jgi:hypothetical protein
MKRFHLIQYLIDNFLLKSYLEIGVQFGQTFSQIKCDKKIGIDPSVAKNLQGQVFPLTSDDFFKQNLDTFDIIFIDGLHLCEQTVLDIVNSWNVLNPKGFIVMHDCLPTCWEMCQRHTIIPEWTGDVWKAVVWFRREYPMVESCVLPMDYGCGVIRKSDEVLSLTTDLKFLDELDFNWLKDHLEELNVQTEYEGFKT